MKKFVPHFEKHILCPADRDMVLNRLTNTGFILSRGIFTRESGRQTITLPQLLIHEPAEIDVQVHCADCPIDGCHLTGTLNKKRG